MTTLYGIPNCDAVKKARKWLEERKIGYTFHDYKKKGSDAERVARWVAEVGWEAVLNRRGTTFRALTESSKSDIDADKAIALMITHPSCIKRPVLEGAGPLLVGFDRPTWERAFA